MALGDLALFYLPGELGVSMGEMSALIICSKCFGLVTYFGTTTCASGFSIYFAGCSGVMEASSFNGGRDMILE